MCSPTLLFRFAGAFVLVSLALAWLVHPAWLAFTAFVGLNLLQTGFTRVCPLERLLGRARFFGCSPVRRPSPATEDER
jgi:hypothetical protein